MSASRSRKRSTRSRKCSAQFLAPKYSAYYFQLQQDPSDYQLSKFLISSDATWNPFHTSVPEVENWIKTIQTGTADQAATAGKALNKYLVQNAWFAPFYRPTFSYASNPKTVTVTMQVGGAAPQLSNYLPVK